MNVLKTELWIAATGSIRADDPGVKPNQNGLPGVSVLKDMAGGVLTIGLVLCVVGLVVAAATWAIASRSGNSHHANSGKTGVLISVGAAIIIGGANALVSWGSGVGGKL